MTRPEFTPLERQAIKLGNAALLASPDATCDIVATVVSALYSAQMLQSPETAAELAAYEVLNPQQCSKGIHADWLVDSENSHACPWCENDRLRAERDAYCNRVDTLTAVAESNKRHVQLLYVDLQKANARVAELEHTADESRTVDCDPIAYSLTPAAESDELRPQVQKLRDRLAGQREDMYVSPLHHDYKVPHDLPEAPNE